MKFNFLYERSTIYVYIPTLIVISFSTLPTLFFHVCVCVCVLRLPNIVNMIGCTSPYTYGPQWFPTHQST
jgi:hypothetical protein